MAVAQDLDRQCDDGDEDEPAWSAASRRDSELSKPCPLMSACRWGHPAAVDDVSD